MLKNEMDVAVGIYFVRQRLASLVETAGLISGRLEEIENFVLRNGKEKDEIKSGRNDKEIKSVDTNDGQEGTPPGKHRSRPRGFIQHGKKLGRRASISKQSHD